MTDNQIVKNNNFLEGGKYQKRGKIPNVSTLCKWDEKDGNFVLRMNFYVKKGKLQFYKL